MKSLEWLKLGKLIDVKCNDNVWRVCKVVKLDQENVEIEYDGWAMHSNTISIESNRLAPFRKFTVKYTGQQDAAERNWVFTDEELIRFNKKLEKVLKNNLGMKSPYKTTQFFRGELFILTENLLEHDYTSNPEVIGKVVKILGLIMQVILKFLENYPRLFEISSNLSDNPDMFLYNNDYALAATWPEILDTLNKLLCLDPRCKKFTTQNNIAPINYVFSEKIIQRENYTQSFLFLLDLFASLGGFEKFVTIAKCFLVPIQILKCVNLTIFKDFIDPNLFEYFSKGLSDGVIERIHRFTDKDMKYLESEVIVSLASNYNSNDFHYSALLQKSFLLMYCKMVKSSFLEKRIKGINEISRYLEIINQNSAYEDDALDIFSKEEMLKEILQTRVHGEVLKRSNKLLNFLAKNCQISQLECQILWNFSKDQQKIISESGFSLIIEICPYIAEVLADDIYNKMISQNPSEINFKIITDFSLKILEISEGRRNYCEAFLMEQLENSKDSQFSSKIIGFLVSIYTGAYSTNLIINFLEQLPEKLSNRIKQTPHDLKITLGIFKKIEEEYIYNYCHEHSIKTLVLKNINLYFSSLASQKDKTFYGIYTHSDHIKSRLEFLEFIFDKLKFRKHLKTNELKNLWDIFVNNPLCESDSMAFFKSINNGISFGSLVNNHARVFECLFLDSKFFKIDDLNVPAFKAFKLFLFKANSEISLEIHKDKFRYVKNGNITGIKILFEIYFNSEERTADCAVKLIKLILTSYSLELKDSAAQLFSDIINFFVSNSQSSQYYNRRALNLFTKLLDIDENNEETFSFHVYYNKYHEIQCPAKLKVRYLRKLIAKQFSMPLSEVCLKIEEDLLFHHNDSKIIKLFKEKPIKLIEPIYKFYEYEDIPNAISNCSSFISQVYNNYIGDSSLSERAWNFLSKIPLSDELYSLISDLNPEFKNLCYKNYQIFFHSLYTIEKKCDDPAWKKKFNENFVDKIMLPIFAHIWVNNKISILPSQIEVFIRVLCRFDVPENYTKEVITGLFKIITIVTPNLKKIDNATLFISQIKYMIESLLENYKEICVEIFKSQGESLLSYIIHHIITEKTHKNYFKKLTMILLIVIKNGNIYDTVIPFMLNSQELALSASKSNYFWVLYSKICESFDQNIEFLIDNIFPENHKIILTLKEKSCNEKNYCLWGLLKINTIIAEKGKIKIKDINEVALKLIFSNNNNPKKASCKNVKTREAAYNYFIILCKNYPECIQSVEKYLDKTFHQILIWRNSNFINWNISIQISQLPTEKPSHGFVGLQNLGCTCYMNSLFQQLFMIPSFSESLLQVDFKDPSSPIYHLKRIFSLLKSSNAPYISPKKFCFNFKDFDDRPLNPNEQMDVFEFYSRLMEKLDYELKATNENKLVQEHFAGTLAVEMISNQCNHRKERNEYMLSIQLDVKSKSGLIESLRDFTSGEVMQGENAYFCEECKKKVNTIMRSSIKYLPNYLVFALGRFEFNYDTMTRKKIDDRFEFPFEMDMKNFTTEYLNKSPLNDSNYYTYQLKGVIIHQGLADQGHYYSFIHDGENWYEFNDTVITLSAQEEVINAGFGKFKSSHSVPTAYILIYERPTKYKQNNCLEAINLSLPKNMDNIDKNYIQKKNYNYWVKKIALSKDFIIFNKSLLDNYLFRISYTVKFFLTILLRVEGMNMEKALFFDHILRHIDEESIFLILNLISSENGLKEFFFFNPNTYSRKIVNILVKKCIDLISQELAMFYLLQYLRYTQYVDRKKVVYFVNYLDVLMHFADKLPEFCREKNIGNQVILLIINNSSEGFPFTEIENQNELWYYEKSYKIVFQMCSDRHAMSIYPVLQYITTHVQDISNNYIDYVKSYKIIGLLYDLVESRHTLRIFINMYCKLFEDEIESSVNFCNYFLGKYNETQSQNKYFYLNAFSLFIKHHKNKSEIVKLVLEHYLTLIPETNAEEIAFYLNHLFIILKGIDYYYIKDIFPDNIINHISNIIEANTNYEYNGNLCENQKFVNFMIKLLCIKEHTDYDDFNHDTDLYDYNIGCGKIVNTFNQAKQRWEKYKVKECYDGELILIEELSGETKNLFFKDIAYDEIYPIQED